VNRCLHSFAYRFALLACEDCEQAVSATDWRCDTTRLRRARW